MRRCERIASSRNPPRSKKKTKPHVRSAWQYNCRPTTLRCDHRSQRRRATCPSSSPVLLTILGPPCPDYSKANGFKVDGSSRNRMVALFLAYCDFYRPKYVLMENVVGLMHHKLVFPSRDDTPESTVENGSIKLIFRTITTMNYQAQCAILYAEEHGAPQTRPRVFLWATLPGYKLPKYPQIQ